MRRGVAKEEGADRLVAAEGAPVDRLLQPRVTAQAQDVEDVHVVEPVGQLGVGGEHAHDGAGRHAEERRIGFQEAHRRRLGKHVGGGQRRVEVAEVPPGIEDGEGHHADGERLRAQRAARDESDERGQRGQRDGHAELAPEHQRDRGRPRRSPARNGGVGEGGHERGDGREAEDKAQPARPPLPEVGEEAIEAERGGHDQREAEGEPEAAVVGEPEHGQVVDDVEER